MSDSAHRPPKAGWRRLELVLIGLPRLIVGSLILFSIFLNCANVVARYVFLSPIYWAEQVMIFVMIWCVFIGATLVTWDDGHLRIDLVSSAMPARWRRRIQILSSLVLIGVCAFVIPQSWEATSLMATVDQRSAVANIPMVIPHSALLLGFVLILITAIVRLRAHASNAYQSEAERVIEAYGGEEPEGGAGNGAEGGSRREDERA